MAKCNCCGREMLTANGCSYKRVVVKGVHKETFKRIKVGDPGDWYEEFVGTPEEKDIRCGDCGAKIGYYHHYGCDIEKCPICGGQELDVVASGMEAMGLSVETGYYDPDDESSVDVPKQLIGFHYVVLKKNA